MSGESSEDYHLVAVLGTNDVLVHQIASFLGKEGTTSDLRFYNRLEERGAPGGDGARRSAGAGAGADVWCVVTPVGYPDKLKPVVQALRLTRVHVLVVDLEEGVTPAVGELVVALDEFSRQLGTTQAVVFAGVTSQNEYKLPEVERLLDSVLDGSPSLDRASIPRFTVREPADRGLVKEYLSSLAAPLPAEDYTKVLVDHCFPVKGIGTVVLGLVEFGEVHAGGMLELTGQAKKVIIRSIQKQDRDFKLAVPGDRVGLAIKGVKPEDVGRDDCLVTPGSVSLAREVEIEMRLNPFFKAYLSTDTTRQYHLVVNLATSPVKVVGGDELKPGDEGTVVLGSEKPLPVDAGGTPGFLVFLEPFSGKLRVLGSGRVTAR
ncbi:MAG: EF-Tu/IF-2/RF-3 family GTPase [Promethearchaeota archaeon]